MATTTFENQKIDTIDTHVSELWQTPTGTHTWESGTFDFGPIVRCSSIKPQERVKLGKE
ncbi:MAG: hypothetical protein KDC35_03575 [Acidobacteria bacterium]|nr:hypothetical protein [Acidobacteriota bacterium]